MCSLKKKGNDNVTLLLSSISRDKICLDTKHYPEFNFRGCMLSYGLYSSYQVHLGPSYVQFVVYLSH